jgi:hypothetical protein
MLPPSVRLATALIVVGLVPATRGGLAAQAPPTPPADGATLYRQACAACHGGDGRGADRALVAFEEALPDFTDCRFASREPEADWVGVAHQGGPVRGFSRMMPSFGAALTVAEIERAVRHVKSLCKDRSWPAGELNLPRPLHTEKAFPEDEWVIENDVAPTSPATARHTAIYEKRFGPRSQIELALPFAHRRTTGSGGSWVGGPGDVTLGLKHALSHGLETGHILSAVAEVKLPTGSQRDGFGSGSTVLEAFLLFAKLLPSESFVQIQAGAERPTRSGAEAELILNAVAGRTFSQSNWGRAWSPMVEVLGKREGNEATLWDIAPQLHVSINTRQHVMMTLGPRIPLNQRDRPWSFVVNVLWDWFDGGLLDGW